MSMHEEALARQQRSALRALGPVMASEAFYLGGGTALAVYLGHRRSVDFDWFTSRESWDAPALAQRLRDRGIALAAQEVAPGTLSGRVGSVRVAFFEYRYPLLAEPVQWPAYGCPLASLDDLACMKLAAIAQRGAKKDFIDIYALATGHHRLPDLLDAYRRKYATDDLAHVLYGLIYFDDADRERMPTLLWDVDWRTVKRSITAWVKELVP